MPRSTPSSLPLRLASFYFAYFAYTAALIAYLPLYLAWRGLRAADIALVLALPQVARIFAPAAWGWIADRGGERRGIVIFSCAVTAASFALLPHAPGLAGIAALIGIMSVLNAGALPLVEATTLGALAGQPGRYGPIRLWGSIGFIAVVLAGGVWLDFQPAGSVATLLALLALASLAAALVLPASAAKRACTYSKLQVPRSAWLLIAAGFCMGAAHAVLYAFFTLHLQRLGYSATLIGVLWTLGVLAEIAVFLVLPALFHRYALATILTASFACAVIRFLIIGWGAGLGAAAPGLLALAQLLHGATFGAFHAGSVAAVQRLFPEGAHARGQALFSGLSNGAGGAAGALLAGWAWQAAGPQFAFSVAAAVSMAGLLFAYTLKRARV